MSTAGNRKIFILLFILILALNFNFTNAQSLEQSLNSLRGINKAGLIIEKVSQVLYDNGIRENEIRKDVEAQLDFAGIKVYQSTDLKTLPGSPYLYVNIGAIKSKDNDLYAVSITVEFRQDVNLIRNPKQNYFGAATWSVSNIGIFSKDKLSEIKGFTKNMVDKFVKDYLKANKM